MNSLKLYAVLGKIFFYVKLFILLYLTSTDWENIFRDMLELV